MLRFTLAENGVLHDYHRPPVARHGLLDLDGMRERAKPYISRYDVRGGGSRDAGLLAVRRQPAEVHPGA